MSPSNRNTYVLWLNILNFQPQESIGNLCLGPADAMTVFAWGFFTPSFYFLILFCSGCFHAGLSKLIPSRLAFEIKSYIRTLISLFLFSYTQVTTNAIQFLDCVYIGPYHVIASIPAIDCDSDRYISWSRFMIFILFSYV